MKQGLVLMLCLAGVGTLAQAQESRLDAVQKSGALRVCTPGVVVRALGGPPASGSA